MKTSCTLVCLLVYLVLAINGNTQYYFNNDKYYAGNMVVELGIGTGLMNCLTDLGGRKGAGSRFIKDLNWQDSRLSASLYGLLMYKDALAIRLEFTRGAVSAADRRLLKKDADINARYGRNLSFFSRINEIQLSIEIHPLFFILHEENKAPYCSPYIISGIGYFGFNPRAELNGHWYDLHPLHLEGQGFAGYKQRKHYALRQPNLILGTGIRYEIGPLINLRLEILHRFLFTDYLDDVSRTYIDPSLFDQFLQPAQAALAKQLYSRRKEIQPGYSQNSHAVRGNALDRDAYFNIQIKLGMIIRKKRSS